MIFDFIPLLQRREVSFLQVEVSSRNYFLSTISPRPIDDLRGVSSEEGTVAGIEWLTVFS